PQAFAPGYAPGQIKICIFPQAMPMALYCTIFALRKVLCKFLIAWDNMQIFIFPQATLGASSRKIHSYYAILAFIVLTSTLYLPALYLPALCVSLDDVYT
ncbi:hypothetical protein Tsp_03511, partial [Trichinella spiralis]|uniref:hypothetical protein n=1 Tax=Trichinella spiralis TaxID=6334 RepID=UPI0001EFB419